MALSVMIIDGYTNTDFIEGKYQYILLWSLYEQEGLLPFLNALALPIVALLLKDDHLFSHVWY